MMLPNNLTAFDEFTNLLSKRIECFGEKDGPFSLSEDTICLYIALAYFKAGIEGHRMEMEVSHPLLEKLSGYDPKIDICVRDTSQCVWLEVKFDRRARSNSIMNVTNRFGALVNDMMRVGLIEKVGGLVVYVTDKQMDQYLQNSFNQFIGTTEFTLDEVFLSALPGSAAGKVNQKMRARIPQEGFSVRLIRTQQVKMLSCYLYEVQQRVHPA